MDQTALLGLLEAHGREFHRLQEESQAFHKFMAEEVTPLRELLVGEPEGQKTDARLLPAVLALCQRLKAQQTPLQDTVERLRWRVTELEGFTVSDEAALRELLAGEPEAADATKRPLELVQDMVVRLKVKSLLTSKPPLFRVTDENGSLIHDAEPAR